jgi:hypothetical protein
MDPIVPVHPDARWTASIWAVLITTVTDVRLTGPEQYQALSTNETVPVRGEALEEELVPNADGAIVTAATTINAASRRLEFIRTSEVW